MFSDDSSDENEKMKKVQKKIDHNLNATSSSNIQIPQNEEIPDYEKIRLKNIDEQKAMFLNNLKKSARALSTSMKPKCPKPKKNPSKTEPILRKKSSRLSVKENLGTSKHGVIRCNFNQGM